MRRTTGALAATVLLGACAYNLPPVPVSGNVAALAGAWTGEYHADDPGGRSGTIELRLSAASDTAYGEVEMVVAGPDLDAPPRTTVHLRPPVPVLQPLTIRFVRAEGDIVTGTLDPYVDPDCGSPVRTTFTGRVAGDVIEGSYRSVHVDDGYATGGTWRVRRNRG